MVQPTPKNLSHTDRARLLLKIESIMGEPFARAIVESESIALTFTLYETLDAYIFAETGGEEVRLDTSELPMDDTTLELALSLIEDAAYVRGQFQIGKCNKDTPVLKLPAELLEGIE